MANIKTCRLYIIQASGSSTTTACLCRTVASAHRDSSSLLCSSHSNNSDPAWQVPRKAVQMFAWCHAQVQDLVQVQDLALWPVLEAGSHLASGLEVLLR